MKTVTIPEQVIKPLIDNLCKREGTETISKLVDQSGLETATSKDLNIVLLMSGQMPDITEGSRIIDNETYTFSKYYAIPQIVEATLDCQGPTITYTFSLEGRRTDMQVTSITFALIMEGEHIQQRLDRLSAQKERVKIKLSQALIKYADDPSENNNAIIQLYEDVLTDIEDEMATLIREL